MDNNKSYWIKSGIYTILERFSALLFGIGSFFFLIRMLSKEEFGIWALFLTITALIEVARNGLIQNAQIKFLTSSPNEEHSKIITASLVLNILLTLFSIIILGLLAKMLSQLWESPILEQMLYYYIFTTAILIPFSQFNFIQQANFDFKGIMWSNVVRQGLLFFYILFTYVFNQQVTLISLAIVQIYAGGAGALIAYLFVRKFLTVTSKIDWAWVNKLFHFGKYVFGTNVSSLFYKGMDQMMLGYLIGTSSVAVYNTAIRISNLVEVPTTSVASMVFPKSAKLVKTEGLPAVKRLYERSVGLILALIIPALILVLVFPKFIILLVAGEGYYDTIPVLQVTMLYSLFIPFLRQFGTALDSIGKPKLNFYFVLFSAGLNFIFNYIFIKQFGTIGAAYGTLVSYSIIFFLNQIILYRELKINTFTVFSHIIDFYILGYKSGNSILKNYLFKKV